MKISLRFSFEESEASVVEGTRAYAKLGDLLIPDWKGIGGRSHGILETEVNADTLAKIVNLIQLQNSN